MCKNLDKQDNASHYFAEFFEILKSEAAKSFGNKDDDQISYGNLAFLNAINSLPCPVSIVKLKINVADHSDVQNYVYYLIKYDISDVGELSVSHYGTIDFGDIQNHPQVMEVFDLSDRLTDIETFSLIEYDDIEQWLWYWVVSDKTLANPQEYSKDFLSSLRLRFMDKIRERFGRKIDYAVKYDLKSDPVLPPSEFLQIDKTTSTLFKPLNNEESYHILEQLQRDVSQVLLSPKVPEDVKRVFSAAKKLYVFGYFEYYFFTISNHYTFLAVESALRNRFTELWPQQRSDVKLTKIINKLHKAHIIRDAEKKQYNVSKDLRDSFSHLTKPPLLMPKVEILETSAFLINQLYEEHKYG